MEYAIKQRIGARQRLSFSKQRGARRSRSDAATFYRRQQKQERIAERGKRRRREDFKNNTQPIGRREGLPKARLMDVARRGRLLARYSGEANFSGAAN